MPADRVLTTRRVSTTAGEATAVAEILKQRSPPVSRILLVTSAFHMRRAGALFRRSGLTVLEYPVDFSFLAPSGVGIMDLLPTAGALAQSQRALREMYGRAYYRVNPL